MAAAARQSWPGKLTVNVSACALQDVLTLLDHSNTRAEVSTRPAVDKLSLWGWLLALSPARVFFVSAEKSSFELADCFCLAHLLSSFG